VTDLSHLSTRDLEQLSAYLDGELSTREAELLRARLENEPALKQAMQQLRATVAVLQELPQVQRPRSFALAEATQTRGYPLLQFSTALAALAFIVVVGADFLVRSAAQAPEPAMIASEELRALADSDRSLELETQDEALHTEAEAEGALQFAAPAEEPAVAPEAEGAVQAPAPAEELAEETRDPAQDELEEMDEFFKSAQGDTEQLDAAAGLDQADLDQAEDAVSEPPVAAVPVDAGAPEQARVSGEQGFLLPALRVGELILGILLVLLVGLSLWTRRR
jgi:hypothetical protein